MEEVDRHQIARRCRRDDESPSRARLVRLFRTRFDADRLALASGSALPAGAEAKLIKAAIRDHHQSDEGCRENRDDDDRRDLSRAEQMQSPEEIALPSHFIVCHNCRHGAINGCATVQRAACSGRTGSGGFVVNHSGSCGHIAVALAALVVSLSAIALGGCTDPVETAADLLATTDTSKAECIGRMRTPFDTLQMSVVYMECGARRFIFTAHPQTRADLHMICAFIWWPAINDKGTGRLLCDNGKNGDMTYDRTDPEHIQTVTRLDNGGRFEFILHEYRNFPNTEPFPE
jgi:hypothetical protein